MGGRPSHPIIRSPFSLKGNCVRCFLFSYVLFSFLAGYCADRNVRTATKNKSHVLRLLAWQEPSQKQLAIQNWKAPSAKTVKEKIEIQGRCLKNGLEWIAHIHVAIYYVEGRRKSKEDKNNRTKKQKNGERERKWVRGNQKCVYVVHLVSRQHRVRAINIQFLYFMCVLFCPLSSASFFFLLFLLPQPEYETMDHVSNAVEGGGSCSQRPRWMAIVRKGSRRTLDPTGRTDGRRWNNLFVFPRCFSFSFVVAFPTSKT